MLALTGSHENDIAFFIALSSWQGGDGGPLRSGMPIIGKNEDETLIVRIWSTASSMTIRDGLDRRAKEVVGALSGKNQQVLPLSFLPS